MNLYQKLIAEIAHLKGIIESTYNKVAKILSIIQALSYNEKKKKLYSDYANILLNELDVVRFALVVREEDKWVVAVSQNLIAQPAELSEWLSQLLNINVSSYVKPENHSFLQQFTHIEPVKHKNVPLSFLLYANRETAQSSNITTNFLKALTNILAVGIENKRLYKSQEDRNILSQNIALAGAMQQKMVPSTLPSDRTYRFDAIYQPQNVAGGDFYYCRKLSDGRLVFSVADVSGKGIDAAILASFSLGVMSGKVNTDLDLKNLVEDINIRIFEFTDGDKFVTLFIAIWDPATCILEYVNAGHERPLLLHNDSITELDLGSTILGIDDCLNNIDVGRIELKQPFTLFIFTDGINDVFNLQGDDDYQTRILQFMESHKNDTPSQINHDILTHADAFRKQKPLPDDLTVLTCQFNMNE